MIKYLKKKYWLPIRYQRTFSKMCKDTDMRPVSDLLNKRIEIENDILKAELKVATEKRDQLRAQRDLIDWITYGTE